ncbi:aminotransferase, classes I and II superfamily [Synechococcus sp. PCC 7335]|uniref:aspartate aminotransferase n=1 Tax=Synechococcus sp. (strain ATCC 29403 / PCC 7335) TaxID=91464 RepID=UPI00017EC004|nr:aspartate aminotransferase [Synechococcus sp. PCC 7335]EDX84113.1 aminotransferase, classes I and II superfamily [Synechococcus sp. PCC 7335]
MTLDWLKPARRLGSLPPYVFARLDELKANARAEGVDLIDLGMGNPGGPTPAPVVEAAISAIGDESNHGYPPFEGTASFRTTITNWYHRRYGVTLDPESEALPLMGSKEGLGHIAMAYIDPGDVVLVPTPSYPAHFRGPAIAGADIRTIPLKAKNNWIIDFNDISAADANAAKVLYFNYPNNPTGAVAPRSFFEEMVAFAHRHQILLIHDLCYAELAFEGYQPTSLLEIPGAKDISVEFHTLSKTYNMAGWRVGFVVGNRHVIQGLRTLKTNLDYGIFSALQTAAETALNLPDHYLEEVQQRYLERRDFLAKELGTVGWNVVKPKATMYLWIPCPPGMGASDFALLLLQKTGVVVTPGTAFGEGGEGYVRISLIAKCDRLKEAVDRLRQANIRYSRVPTSV